MHVLRTVLRLLDAIGTALAVVVGLVPDPTTVPVERDTRHYR